MYPPSILWLQYSNLLSTKAQKELVRQSSELRREVRRGRLRRRLRRRWLVKVLEVAPHVEPLGAVREVLVGRRRDVGRPGHLREHVPRHAGEERVGADLVGAAGVPEPPPRVPLRPRGRTRSSGCSSARCRQPAPPSSQLSSSTLSMSPRSVPRGTHSLAHAGLSSSPESVCVRPLRRLTRFLCLDADEVAGPGGRGAVPPACPDGGAWPGCGEEANSFCSALRVV